jgi:hypothetical protein
MVSPPVFSQRILCALLWLVVLVHLTRPQRPVTAPATPPEKPEPLTPQRHRSNAPQPCEGLTHQPHCALCARYPRYHVSPKRRLGPIEGNV